MHPRNNRIEVRFLKEHHAMNITIQVIHGLLECIIIKIAKNHTLQNDIHLTNTH